MTRSYNQVINVARICIPLTLASLTWLVTSLGSLALARQNPQILFRPRPGQGAPSQTAGGGTRTSACSTSLATKVIGSEDANSPDPLTLLTLMVPGAAQVNALPADPEGQEIGSVPLTASGHPSFLVYVPQTLAEQAEFTIQSDVRDDAMTSRHYRYRTFVTLDKATAKSGSIVKVDLPPDQPALQVGETYRWNFTLICKESDRFRDAVVEGRVQRVSLDPELKAKLTQASLVEQSALYGRAGIWYDMLATLAEVKQANQGDQAILNAWESLLNSETVQLTPFTGVPLN